VYIILTYAVWNAAVPEEVQTFDDLCRRSWSVVEHVTFSAAQVGEERLTVDEIDGVEMLIIIESWTTVTYS